jgi:hypothetical protein
VSDNPPTSYAFHYSRSDVQSHLIPKGTDHQTNTTGELRRYGTQEFEVSVMMNLLELEAIR